MLYNKHKSIWDNCIFSNIILKTIDEFAAKLCTENIMYMLYLRKSHKMKGC